MSKRTTSLIMLIFTLSMAGFLIAQMFWIRNAFGAMDETFRQIHNNALRDVVQKMGRYAYYPHGEITPERIDADANIVIDSLLSPCGLDGLMRVSFGHFRLHNEYEYAILDHLTGRLHYSSAGDELTNYILQSPYRENLKSVFDSERFSLLVWFRYERMVMLRHQGSWLLVLSFLLFCGIIVGYILTISRLLSQKRLTMMQKDFINNTTHEFKTPLASISVAAEMIMSHRGNMPDSQVARYASIIFEENKRLQRQVERVLQLSLLDEESYRYDKQMEPLQPLLDRAVETGRIILRDKGGEIILEGRYGGELLIDKQHILNVFNNLIENAIKYSHDEPFIRISLEVQEEGVILHFADRGIGIANEELDRIFDRLYRVPDGDLFHTSGSGIGLYYVRKVMEAHHGHVSVKSMLGEGSVFALYFPFNH
jgi:two-component system, OmpR family, phosphate regulon sensor histidine kinase PhoR